MCPKPLVFWGTREAGKGMAGPQLPSLFPNSLTSPEASRLFLPEALLGATLSPSLAVRVISAEASSSYAAPGKQGIFTHPPHTILLPTCTCPGKVPRAVHPCT